METWAERIIAFNRGLRLPIALPDGVEVLHPYAQAETRKLSEFFYRKFYNDTAPRKCLLGINPGRLGGGLTGVPFVDPIGLENDCGIPNDLPKKTELSATFMRQVMMSAGGWAHFYQRFYISAVCPLGFVKNGKNMNYYELPNFRKNLSPYLIEKLQEQLTWAMDRRAAYCIGEGENYQYLRLLNEEHRLFEKIIPLPHPRFIMQYRRRRVEEYVKLYHVALLGGSAF